MLRAFSFVWALILCTSASAQTEPAIPKSAAGVSAAQRLQMQKLMEESTNRSSGGVAADFLRRMRDDPAAPAGEPTSPPPNKTACGRYPYPPCDKAAGEDER